MELYPILLRLRTKADLRRLLRVDLQLRRADLRRQVALLLLADALLLTQRCGNESGQGVHP